jgi:excisionase family DNA binding protein
MERCPITISDPEHLDARNAIPSADDWMTPAEAAVYLGLHRSTLYKWRRLGIGPRYFKLGRRQFRYRRSDLDAYIAIEGRVNAHA